MTEKEELEDRRKLLRSLAELRILEGATQEFAARISVVSNSLTELKLSSDTLEGLKGRSELSHLFIPIGGGSYIEAKTDEVDHAIVGIGAGVALKKPIDEAIDSVKTRIAELEKVKRSLERQLAEVIRAAEGKKAEVSELTRKLGERQRSKASGTG